MGWFKYFNVNVKEYYNIYILYMDHGLHCKTILSKYCQIIL